MTPYDIVIPTAGRPSLRSTVEAIRHGDGPQPGQLIVVDDRADRSAPLPLQELDCLVFATAGQRGPATARNVGWRASTAPWVVFLDDDVVPDPEWAQTLQVDLARATDRTAGVQGRIQVPRAAGRPPTDAERNVQGLERAQWATADLAFRRSALIAAGGFDERFPRAYREDADLGLRLTRRGWTIARGSRNTVHPVGAAPWWASVRRQIGNRDDPLMAALHGRDWRSAAGTPPGLLSRHRWTTAAWMLGAGAILRRAPKLAGAAFGGAAALTARFAAERISPGPKTPDEIAAMVATSIAIPPVATAWWAIGRLELPSRRRRRAPHELPDAVLLDRDGTLIVDVPYNGEPDRVEPMPGAVEAVQLLRSAGVPLAVVSNQSGIARGVLTSDQVQAVNARVDELFGGFDAWLVCPHGPDGGCGCRKPAPGMVFAAAEELGVLPSRCVMIGDIEADVAAAAAAGARGVLVPTARTLREEVDRAETVAADLLDAAYLALGGPAA